MKSLEVNTRETKLFFLVLRFNFGKLELYCFQRKLRYDNLVSAIVLRPKFYCELLSTYKSVLTKRFSLHILVEYMLRLGFHID